MTTNRFYASYDDIWIVDGALTPMVDYCATFSQISSTDMGIKVAREILARTGVADAEIGSVITGNLAPGDFFQYFLPRHVGMYAGVPLHVPAVNVQRICGTGFGLFRQAADQIKLGYTDTALVVGTESMSSPSRTRSTSRATITRLVWRGASVAARCSALRSIHRCSPAPSTRIHATS